MLLSRNNGYGIKSVIRCCCYIECFQCLQWVCQRPTVTRVSSMIAVGMSNEFKQFVRCNFNLHLMHTVVNSFLRRVTHVHVLQCFALNIHENIGKSADPLARRRVGVHGQSRFHCYIRCQTATLPNSQMVLWN